MKDSAPTSISSDKIMLSKDQALANSWGANKQEEWGKLTNMVIVITSEMLKKGQFKDVNELYWHLAKARSFIGYILKHPSESGQPRTHAARTPITSHPDSAYKHMYPEFKSCIESLLDDTNKDYVELSAEKLQLKGLAEQDGKIISYDRSGIANYKGPDFQIFHVSNASPHFTLAQKQFEKLTKEKQLSKEEKQACVEAIYYYLADAMPCERGAASIVQMMFYVLEDAFTDNMRYLGKQSSQYGHNQGVLPDLAAILSPTFEDFKIYFNKNIVDTDIVVNKTMPQVESVLMPAKAFSEEIDNTLSKFKAFTKAHETMGAAVQDIQVYQYHNAVRLCSAIEYIKNIIDKNPDNENLIKYCQLMYGHLKENFIKDARFYYKFYPLVKEQEGWPPPRFKHYDEFDPNMNFKEYTDDIIQYLGFLKKYRWTFETISNYSVQSNTRNISGSIEQCASFLRSFLKSEPPVDSVDHFLSIFVDRISESTGIYQVIDEVIQNIGIMEKEQNEGVSKDETLNGLIPKIENIQKVYEAAVKSYSDTYKLLMSEMYDNIDKQKATLVNLSPCIKDNLKNKDMLDAWQAEKAPRSRPSP